MSTALYRRYRPETFAEVIGQKHVTEPLMTALQNNRVNHAYLFSGPRGCGKTTSARILARCLNCGQGPTPTPCGVCDSCVELARDGSGSLDVIEMDAASHGGVDHARDLRERATFAPVRDRYKIFIIDEAHMVTREGFNALLKIVEEPPEHIKFIFATTEPNKVLGTVRSRTHHYPFRLVPPETLHDYLAKLCDEEGVKVEEGVLQLVVRAGGGSVRDSLSTLDQLMAGSGEDGITYDVAVALLGFTHAELLDEVVMAFAVGNAADVFSSVDRVIQTGQDPRRFVEDLLERFRDLIIVQAVPQAAESVLHGMNVDQIARLRAQASAFGAAELSRAADVTNAGLNEMSGATSPQLHLELLCARILLPASDKTVGGVGARLDRLERRIATGDIPASAQNSAELPESDSRQVSGQISDGIQAQAPQRQSSQQNQLSQTPARPPIAAAPLANLKKRQQERTSSNNMQENPPAAQEPSPQISGTPQHQSDRQSTAMMVANSWKNIVDRVQSPLARQGFTKCEPSKFERGALYIRADITTLRQVKDYIPQLKTALREEVQLDCDVHAEVAKKDATAASTPSVPKAIPPLQAQNSPAQGGSQQKQNGQLQNSHQALADGPRGGEEAWRTHGQPRSKEPPQWSTEDWNNPVTHWEVADIPSEDSSAQNHSSTMNTEDTSPENTEASREESGPQLRVIPGEATETSDRSRANHPSSGRWHRPEISAAPNPASSDDADSKEETEDPVTAGEETAEKSAESSPLAANPQQSQAEDHSRFSDDPDSRPTNTGIADGTAEEAPAEESMIPDPPHSASSAASVSGQRVEGENPGPKVTEHQPTREITDEYGTYEGGNFDDAPAEEPEYIAGLGYVDNSVQAPPAPQGVLPPLGGQAPSQEESESRNSAPVTASTQPPNEQKKPTAPSSKPGFRERYAAQLKAGQQASKKATVPPPAQGAQEPEDFSVSEEDEALESSVLIGQRAIEKVLGGVVIEERLHGQ